MKEKFSKISWFGEKQKYGVYFGIGMGLAYTFALWIADVIILTSNHSPYPWVKLILGAVIFCAITALAGWLTAVSRRVWAAPFFWLPAAYALGWATLYIIFKLSPAVIKIIDPSFQGWIEYSFNQGIVFRMGVSLIWLFGICLVGGLFENALIEHATDYSTTTAGRFIILLPALVMLMAGYFADDIINKPMRDPVVYTNNTKNFIIEHKGQEIDKKLARTMHVAAFRGMDDLLEQPRQIVVGDFDITLEQTMVYIRFGEQWVVCETFSYQPVNCKKVDAIP